MPLIGILSDTHGKLDARVLHLFDRVDAILHAGDVGLSDILIDLESIAPTWAVKGNVDCGSRLDHLPLRVETDTCGIRFLMAHGHLHDNPETRVARILAPVENNPPALLVLGHSHHPELFVHPMGVLVLNPGSASQPRYGFPKSVGFVETKAGKIVAARVCDLEGKSFLEYRAKPKRTRPAR